MPKWAHAAPQNSRTSVGLYRSAVSGDGDLPFKMEFVEEWHDEPKRPHAVSYQTHNWIDYRMLHCQQRTVQR